MEYDFGEFKMNQKKLVVDYSANPFARPVLFSSSSAGRSCTVTEGKILHRLGKLYPGRWLEIGGANGVSAKWLVEGNPVLLDSVDPIYATNRVAVEGRFSAIAASHVNLISTTIEEWAKFIGQGNGRLLFRYKGIFIDGKHDGPNPLENLLACVRFLEKSGIVVLHDGVCPAVREAIKWLTVKRWNCEILPTEQLLAIASRFRLPRINIGAAKREKQYAKWLGIRTGKLRA